MHVSSVKDSVEIRGRDSVLLVGGIFPIKETHPRRRNYLLQVCAFISEVRAVCEGLLHTGGSLMTEEILRKEIGGLED